jgi:hypothetical protein
MVDDGGVVAFKLGSGLMGPEVTLNTFSVVRQVSGRYDYSNPNWRVSIRPGSYSAIFEIKYGGPVAGFPESEARPLVEGERYQASMHGAGMAGSVEFELVRRSGKLAVLVFKAN